LRTGLFSLDFVNVLHHDALVLEDVTLGLHVQAVVPADGCKHHSNNYKTHMCLSILPDSRYLRNKRRKMR
jgi:hypothetical protein